MPASLQLCLVEMDRTIAFQQYKSMKTTTIAMTTKTARTIENPLIKEEVTVLLEPGKTGFETALQVAYGLARDGRTNRKGIPKSLYHMALIIRWSDTNLPGIFHWMEPVMVWLARRAEKKGIDKELVAAYCRI